MPFSCAASRAQAICLARFWNGPTIALLQTINRRDVGIVQRRQRLRFALKTAKPFGIVGKYFR